MAEQVVIVLEKAIVPLFKEFLARPEQADFTVVHRTTYEQAQGEEKIALVIEAPEPWYFFRIGYSWALEELNSKMV